MKIKIILILTSIGCISCTHIGFPGDGAFRITGTAPDTSKCILKVGLAEGTWVAQPRPVNGRFSETYVVSPLSNDYTTDILCGSHKIAKHTFSYSGKKGMQMVNLDEYML